MKKYKFTLNVCLTKEYILEGESKDDVELQAIEHFKENIFSEIDENECYGKDFEIVD